jgi:phage baseplate assembly protein W
MMSTYGAGVRDAVFMPNAPATVQILKNQISQAINVFEPKVQINNILVVPDANNPGQTGVEIDWSSRTLNASGASGVVTATILVGGTVIGE